MDFMIKPATLKPRNIKIGSSGPSEVAQICVSMDGKVSNLLVGVGILIRFDYTEPRHNKCFKNIQKSIVQDKKFLQSQKQKILDNLIITEQELREMTNKYKRELTRRDSSAVSDFLDSVKKREQKLERFTKKLRFDAVRSQPEYFCPNCNGFRSGPDLAAAAATPTCNVCTHRLKKKRIRHLETDVFDYLHGFWVEDYVAELLHETGWQAWSLPSLHIHGASGVRHQIDVLAVKNGRVLIVECKKGDFTPSKVVQFLGKYYDIRSHQALAVAVGTIHPDGMKMIEKNLSIRACDKMTSRKRVIRLISKL